MEEAQAVANKLGITFRTSIEKRVEGAAKVGKHKTSMLQDVEGGRLTEIDSMVGSVWELGELVGVPTPSIYALYACMHMVNTKIKEENTRVVSFSADEYQLQPWKEDSSLVSVLHVCMIVRGPDRLGLLLDITSVVARYEGNIGICKTLVDEEQANVLLTLEAPAEQVQRMTNDLKSRHGFNVEVRECDDDYRSDLPFSLPYRKNALPLSEFAQIVYQKTRYGVSGVCADRPGVLKTLAGLLQEHELCIDDMKTHQQTVPVTEDKTVTAFVFEAQVHCEKDIDMLTLQEQFKSASRVLGGTLEFKDLHNTNNSAAQFVSPSKQISAVAVQSKL
jgi:glycine cleavage system regulatory protein